MSEALHINLFHGSFLILIYDTFILASSLFFFSKFILRTKEVIQNKVLHRFDSDIPRLIVYLFQKIPVTTWFRQMTIDLLSGMPKIVTSSSKRMKIFDN